MQREPPGGFVSFGLDEGAHLGGTATIDPARGGVIVGFEVNIGAGLPIGPVPANLSGGVTNTYTLYDFGR